MGNMLASSDVDCWFQPWSMKLVFVASQLTHIIKEKKQRLVRETEGAFTYRQSRETVNIGHLRRRPTKQKNTKQYVYHYTQANTNRFFLRGTPVYSNNKTNRHDMAEIVMKVALDTIKQTVNGEVYSIQNFVMKFVSDLRQVGGFLRVLRFPPPT